MQIFSLIQQRLQRVGEWVLLTPVLKHKCDEKAWIIWQGTQFWAKPSPPLQSATWNLIAGMFAEFGKDAKRILRLPIHVNYEPGLVCKETLKLAAKRFQKNAELSQPPLPQIQLSAPTLLDDSERVPGEQGTQQNWVERLVNLQALIEKTNAATPRFERNRNVIAMLISDQGRLLAQARNTNAISKYQHAEVNCALQYWRNSHKKIPVGSVLLVSLQPCRMCSAVLHEMSEDPTKLKILYLAADPGPKAQICWIPDCTQVVIDPTHHES